MSYTSMRGVRRGRDERGERGWAALEDFGRRDTEKEGSGDTGGLLTPLVKRYGHISLISPLLGDNRPLVRTWRIYKEVAL
ncbi:unnamed protein product [Pleuronectes platessa]|uniref:Uncharacterized protein n=1 Tax=Pleuronectes platessa TaxID=8262 RepID=A0A9N7U426_PLEPL|nr:unnamed protein product [Pleuronectes platessa]